MKDDQRKAFDSWARSQTWSFDVVCTCGLDPDLVEAVRRYTDAPLVVYEPRDDRYRETPGAIVCRTKSVLRNNVFGRMQEGGDLCDIGACEDEEVASEYAEVMADVQRLVALNDITYRKLAAPWARAVLDAMWSWVGCPLVDDLADALQGASAIIVGAGPSLDRNVAALRVARGRAVIAATNSAVGTLAAAGVHPDIVCVQDSDEALVAQLARRPDVTERATLIAGSHVSSGVHELPWARRIVVAEEGGPLARWLRSVLGAKRRYISGGSVATFAFAAMGTLGVRHVILAGCDCALSDGRFHSTGTGMEASVSHVGSDIRIAYDHGRVEDHNVVLVDAWGGGGVVETTPALDSYRIFWVDAAAALAGQCALVNATEGGARLEGWREASLSDAIAECAHGVDVAAVLERAWTSAPKIDAPRLADALRVETLRAAELRASLARARALAADLEAADADVRDRLRSATLVHAGEMTAVYGLVERDPIRRVLAIYDAIGHELSDGLGAATAKAIEGLEA